VIICGDYNIINAIWSHDNLGLTALGALVPSTIALADSFPFLNLFLSNYEYNKLGGLLHLIFINGKNLSINQATSLKKTHITLPYPGKFSLPIPSGPKPRYSSSYRNFNKTDYNSISSFFLLSTGLRLSQGIPFMTLS